MRLRAALVAVPLIVLPMLAAVACSSGSSSSSTSDSSGTETASSSEAATLGPSVPAATAVAAPVDASLLPTASGAFGEKPTLTFPLAHRSPAVSVGFVVARTGLPVLSHGLFTRIGQRHCVGLRFVECRGRDNPFACASCG